MMEVQFRQKKGPEHLLCQDHFRIHRKGNDLYMAAADGHGGPAYTRSCAGSRLATYAAVTLMEQGVDPEDFPAALKDLFDHLVAENLRKRPLTGRELKLLDGLPPSYAYGTTLLAVSVTPNGVRMYQLGDGEIHLLGADGRFLPGLPDDPNCGGGHSTSLVQDRDFVIPRFRRGEQPSCTAVMMFTDGYTGAWKMAEGLMAPDSIRPHIIRTLREGDVGDDQTFLLAYDPAVAVAEPFRTGLGASVETARSEEQLQQRLQCLRQQFEEVSTYLALALQQVQRMAERQDPGFEAYRQSLLPSYRTYNALKQELSTLCAS